MNKPKVKLCHVLTRARKHQIAHLVLQQKLLSREELAHIRTTSAYFRVMNDLFHVFYPPGCTKQHVLSPALKFVSQLQDMLR